MNGIVKFVNQQGQEQNVLQLNAIILSADYRNQILFMATDQGLIAHNFQYNQQQQVYTQSMVTKVQYIQDYLIAISVPSITNGQLELAKPKQIQHSVWGQQQYQLSDIPKYKILFFDTNTLKERTTYQSQSFPSHGFFSYSGEHLLVPLNINYQNYFCKLFKLSVNNSSSSVSTQDITVNQQENQLSQVKQDFIVVGCCFFIESSNKFIVICGSNGQIIIHKQGQYGGYYSYSNNKLTEVISTTLQISTMCYYTKDIVLIGTQRGELFAYSCSQKQQQQLNLFQSPITYLSVQQYQYTQNKLYIGLGQYQQQQQKQLQICQIFGDSIQQIRLQ